MYAGPMDNSVPFGVEAAPEGEPKKTVKLTKTQKEVRELKKRLDKQEEITSKLVQNTTDPSFDEMESFVEDDEEAAKRKSKTEGYEEVNLAQDTFAFLVATRPCSKPFITALFVVLFKNAIFLMVFLDMHDPDDGFSIPAMVDFTVSLAQVMALVMAVLTQNDLVAAAMAVYHGYHDTIRDTFPEGGRLWQWLLGVVLSFLDGSYGLIVTFFLIVTSETAFDVFLNFAAVEFVAGLDEIVFGLAQLGLVGRTNMKAAEIVEERAFLRPKRAFKTPWAQIFFMIIVFMAVFSGWLVIHLKQKRGDYATQTIMLQFDDSINPSLAAYSGFYDIGEAQDRKSGFLYKEARSGNGRVGYCDDRRTWTFFVGGSNPCTGIQVESTTTDSFDVTDVSTDNWFVRSENSITSTPMDGFYLSAGCEKDEDCGNGQGKCKDYKCQCSDGFTGIRCFYQVEEICDALTLDERFEASLPTFRSIASSYDIYMGGAKTCYGRPVYMNNGTKDVIFFTGLRWAIGNTEDLFGASETINTTAAVLERLVSGDFHACEVAFVDSVSSPVRFRSDDDTEASPIGLSWSTTRERSEGLCNAELTQTTQRAEFLCSECNNSSNPCLYEGVCETNGGCTCQHRASGSLCQVVPARDGFCDSFFNRGPFSFDGGDCCQPTCKNTLENTCGVVGNENGVRLVDIGFGSCVDPAVNGACQKSNASCYVTAAEIEPSTPSRTRPYVSANGRFMAVAEVRFASTRLYELKGSEWTQLGGAIKPPRAEFTGEAVSIVSQSGDIVGTREAAPQLYAGVISYPAAGANPGTVIIYRYSRDRVGRFDDWGVIEYEKYFEEFVQNESLVEDYGQQTGSLTVGFHELCETCSENPVTVLLNRFEVCEQCPGLLGTSDIFHLHYRDTRECLGAQYQDSLHWNGTDFLVLPRDEICGDQPDSFYFAYSNYSMAAALSGDGRIFAKVPVEGISIDFWVSPFLEFNKAVGNSFQLNDMGVEGKILELKLSHYGSELTVVTNSSIHLFAVDIIEMGIWELDPSLAGVPADFKVLQVANLTMQSSFNDFSFPELEGAKSSAGGSSVILYRFADRTLAFLDQNTNYPILDIDYQIVSYDRFKGVWRDRGSFKKQEPFEAFFGEDFPSISVSDDGDTLAYTSNTFTEVEVKSLVNSCNDTEYLFRMSITGDLDMALSSWSFASVYYSSLFKTAVVTDDETSKDSFSCAWCYSGKNEVSKYDNRVVAEKFCIPKKSWLCSRFYLAMRADNSSTSTFGSGFAAYQVDGPNTTLVAAEGNVQLRTGFSKVMSDESACQAVSQPSCEEGQTLFSLLFPLSNNPKSLSWRITAAGSVFTDPVSSPDYSNYPPGQFVLEQKCLSQGICYSLEVIEVICSPYLDDCISYDECSGCDTLPDDSPLFSSQNYSAYWGDEPAFSGRPNFRTVVSEAFGDCGGR